LFLHPVDADKPKHSQQSSIAYANSDGRLVQVTRGRRSIASRLDYVARPSDAEVEAAVNFVLSVGGVSAGSILLCSRTS